MRKFIFIIAALFVVAAVITAHIIYRRAEEKRLAELARIEELKAKYGQCPCRAGGCFPCSDDPSKEGQR